YGIAAPVSLSFQPVNVAELKAFLAKVDSLTTAGELSPEEAFQIGQLRAQFVEPRRLAGWQSKVQDKSAFVNLSLLGDVDPSFRDSAALRCRGTISPGLSGNIGNLSFYSGIDVWTDWYTDTLFHGSNYQPYNGIPYNLYNRADSAHLRSSDLPRGGVRYKAKQVELETGIDYLRIGPAVYYPLLLSGNAPPLTYGRARWDIGPFVYTHMVALLESQKDKSKYLYVHRLGFPLWKDRLSIGVNEAIVNGSTTDEQPPSDPHNALRLDYYGQNRSWEWAYLIPFVPFKFSEHYLGDRDNAFISFDADMHYPKNFRGYVEVLIDDMLAPWKALTDDWGNKWAFTLGGQYFGRVHSKDVTATVEYSRVEPWVYTHFYGGSHRYTDFDQCLGMPLGPDADALVVGAQVQVSPRNAIGFKLTNIRKNSSARGGNITDVFQDSLYDYNDTVIRPLHPDNPKKTFLGPGTQTSTRLGVSWKYAPFGIFKIDALLEYEFSNGKNGVYGHASGGFVF
ncbi:MAG TPA: capsule assembly Wzi family protein, partial [Chitinivibrionales bacterium]